MSYSPVGLEKWALDTPALLIDLDRLDRNIARIADRCKSSGVNWRPHTKGHKNPAIAHRLLDAGAIGITCAKLGEAEVMAAAGIRDILVANQVVGRQKIARLVGLRRHADVMVAVDHPQHIRDISEAAQGAGVGIRILIEIDVGLHRCGVAPGEPARDLARLADDAPGIVFAGLMGYEGHALGLPDGEKQDACEKAMALLHNSKAMIENDGIAVGIISAGGTGSLSATPDCEGVTEIQAGGGIMMDAFYQNTLHVQGLEHALTVLSTVVSTPTPDRAVIDAGRKTMLGEQHLPVVLSRPGVTLRGLSAEHGTLALADGAVLRIGDPIELIAGYSDMTVFLHDRIYGTRGDRVEIVWDIQGRGKLQ